MSKKIIFCVIGFFAVFLFAFTTATHAAEPAPSVEINAGTRALLGQTLDVLQVVLNQIDARLHGPANPIQNKLAVSSALGGIKTALVSINARIVYAPSANAFGDSGAGANSQAGVAENGQNASAGSEKPGVAAVSWLLGPRMLLVLLPVAVLFLVTFSFIKKNREDEVVEVHATETQGTIPLPDPVQ